MKKNMKKNEKAPLRREVKNEQLSGVLGLKVAAAAVSINLR
jgi:hypothetical protein